MDLWIEWLCGHGTGKRWCAVYSRAQRPFTPLTRDDDGNDDGGSSTIYTWICSTSLFMCTVSWYTDSIENIPDLIRMAIFWFLLIIFFPSIFFSLSFDFTSTPCAYGRILNICAWEIFIAIRLDSARVF